MENSRVVPHKIKNRITIWPSNSTLGTYRKGSKERIWTGICTLALIALSFSVAKKRPSVDEWISKMWCIHKKGMLLFSHSVMSTSLWPHELQHNKLPCPSLSLWVCSDSCPSSRWCHPTISSSVVPFSSVFQSFPASVFSNESSLHQVATVLELQLHHQSFQWISRVDFL